MEQCLCISWSMAENVLRKLQRNNFSACLGPMQNLSARKLTCSIFGKLLVLKAESVPRQRAVHFCCSFKRMNGNASQEDPMEYVGCNSGPMVRNVSNEPPK